MISVIIPTYNRANYILEAINSVCSQEYDGEIEIIVVNDGSTDNTLSILEKANVHNLKVITTPNRGVSSARNTGLAAANGNYIQFLDSDDILAPTKFKKQISLLEKNPDYGLSYCTTSSFNKNHLKNINIFTNSDVMHKSILPGFMISNLWQVHSPIYRRESCKKIGLWNTRLSCWEDWEYAVRAGLQNIKPLFCNATLGFAREHNGVRLSRGQLNKTANSLQIACDSIIDKLDTTQHPDIFYSIISRHLIAAGRAFASLNQKNNAKRCFYKARITARNPFQKIGITCYMILSCLFGYKRVVTITRKLTELKSGNL